MGSCLSTSDNPSRRRSPAPPPPRKKQRRSSSARKDAEEEQRLRVIPGRTFRNGGTGAASLFTQQGKKGINQDAMIVWENFCSRMDTVFCGVFDGHGPFGHMVSSWVRDSLPLKLSAQWEVNNGNNNCKANSISTVGSMNSEAMSSVYLEEESRGSFDFEEKEKHPETFMALKQSFLKAFKVMDKELGMHPNIDCFCSGTTAVTLVKQGQDLVIGNIGDSRAILGTRDQDDSLIAVQLTVDLKPNLPREAERIRRCKGRVFALHDEPEVARVWLPNNDSPGLAMARSFGDFCLKKFGLISVPDISYRRITERDEFIVLATDGVWDVLSNEEVVAIVASAPTRSYAAHSLVESAVRTWRLKYPTSKIDDCAVVCLFLNSKGTSINTSCSSAKMSCDEYLDSTGVGSDKKKDLSSSSVPTLPRSSTVRSSEITQEEDGEVEEGVARVDTLLTLPRFVADTHTKR
ncbi:putative protein phosphatase 2C 33 [Iris pallida]|uniref:protein-serine/threonine phosphatase n=1 Tax=Iris pallida TaxID=29817 RepID=A0AAX6GKS6_IRIPA|nr:putative protein phosphatase 2C 33 [Iris pallida]